MQEEEVNGDELKQEIGNKRKAIQKIKTRKNKWSSREKNGKELILEYVKGHGRNRKII